MIKFIFPVISIILFITIALKIPRRLTYIEIYANTFFTMCLQLVTDIILDLRFDMYSMLQKGPDLLPLLINFGIYPAFSYIFLNFFPFKKKLKKKILYILFFTVAATLFEWMSLKAGYFTHVTWKLWYSTICDILIYIILTSNLRLIRRLLRQEYIKH